MKFAEALVFIGMFQWNLVGESEEKEAEGFSWDKVKVGCLDLACSRLGFGDTMKGVTGRLHLFELMYDRGVEFMLVGEVVLKIVTGRECLWAERTAVVLRELAEESMEVEMTEHRGGVLTALTTEEGKVTVVHSDVVECGEETKCDR
jgi:hypothetical protein